MSFLKKLLLTAFFAVSAVSYLGPVVEGDFFWHLKSGQMFWQTKTIGYFSSQWLGQMLLYFIWKVSGAEGTVLFRALVYTSVLVGLFFWMRKKEIPFFLILFFLFFPAHIFLYFPSERPQIFSFLLFPLTLFLLETFRDEGGSGKGRLFKKAYWALPFIVILWANMHAGFLIGAACMWVYFLAEIIYFIRKKTNVKRLLSIAALCVSPALILFFRPQTITLIPEVVISVLFPGQYVKSIMEYLSPAAAALKLHEYYPAYWIFLAITLLTLVRGLRRMPLTHILLMVFLAGISLSSLRFMPFLIMAAPIVASYNIPKMGSMTHKKGTAAPWENSRLLLAGFAAILVLWLVFIPKEIRPGISEEFPEEAVGFIERVKPRGEIFNYQGWAGYLLWSLPDKKMFIPVENIPADVDDSYGKVIWADSSVSFGGRPQWRSLLDAYGIDIIMMPGISPISGELYPLIEALKPDREWFLVYSDKVSNIYLRGTPENAGIISIYSLPKANAYLQIKAQAERRLKKDPKNRTFGRSLRYVESKLALK